MRGGDRELRARRSLSTLSPQPREPTKQMGPYRQPGGLGPPEVEEAGTRATNDRRQLLERGREAGRGSGRDRVVVGPVVLGTLVHDDARFLHAGRLSGR